MASSSATSAVGGSSPPKGLINIGNTCWINSLCQAFATIPYVRDISAQLFGKDPQSFKFAFRVCGTIFAYIYSGYDQDYTKDEQSSPFCDNTTSNPQIIQSLIQVIASSPTNLVLALFDWVKTEQKLSDGRNDFPNQNYKFHPLPIATLAFVAHSIGSPWAGAYLLFSQMIAYPFIRNRVPSIDELKKDGLVPGERGSATGLEVSLIAEILDFEWAPYMHEITIPFTLGSLCNVETYKISLCATHAQKLIGHLELGAKNESDTQSILLTSGRRDTPAKYFKLFPPPTNTSRAGEIFAANTQVFTARLPDLTQCTYNISQDRCPNNWPNNLEITLCTFGPMAIFDIIDASDPKSLTIGGISQIDRWDCRTQPIHVQEKIRLPQNGRIVEYNLIAQTVLLAFGTGGHYGARVHRDGKWYECSDTNITEIDKPIGTRATLLFYVDTNFLQIRQIDWRSWTEQISNSLHGLSTLFPTPKQVCSPEKNVDLQAQPTSQTAINWKSLHDLAPIPSVPIPSGPVVAQIAQLAQPAQAQPVQQVPMTPAAPAMRAPTSPLTSASTQAAIDYLKSFGF